MQPNSKCPIFSLHSTSMHSPGLCCSDAMAPSPEFLLQLWGELWLLGCCWGPKLWHVLQLHTLIMFASRPTAAARIHPACVPESLLQAQDKVRCFVRRFCMCVNSKMFCCACYDDDDIIERKTQLLLLVLSMFVVLLLPPSTLFWVLLPLHIPQGQPLVPKRIRMLEGMPYLPLPVS